MHRRIREIHAGVRIVERIDGAMSLHELKERLKKGEVQYLARQSVTRSLCRTSAPDGFIYMIVNRKRKSIITVLTEEQALIKMQEMGRDVAGMEDSGEKKESNC